MEQLIKILTAIKNVLGNEYRVITAYDETLQIQGGIIAVSIDNVENLRHGQYKDYKFTLSVNGQYLIDEDLDQSKIKTMFSYCLSKLTEQQIKNEMANCVGVIIDSGSLSNDGESNNFTIAIQLYNCDCVFVENSSSSISD